MPASRAELERYVTYRVKGARLNLDVPPNHIQVDQQARLSGVDGRFSGAWRTFYGFRLLVNLPSVTGLTTIADNDGVSFLQEVIFQKRGTATVYRGFVIRWDADDDTANEDVGLAYTTDGGSTWAYLQIHDGSGNGIGKTTAIEAATHRGYLMVAVEGLSTKTVYWNGAALVAVDSGPGSFGVTLGAMTEASQAGDTSYHLAGNGVFQVRFRFYSSTRGIYSAMSDPVTVYMDQPKLAKAHGAVYFASSGGDSGLLIDGDVITVNGRTFEADDDSSYSGNVQVDINGLTTIAQHAQALADAINGDTANCLCTARAESAAVYIEASTAGVAGNAYGLSVTETGANTDDLSVSSATLTDGGASTSEYLAQCKAVLDFPNNGAVVAGKTYADFDALFDTVDVFRTIDLGQVPAAQQGAIFYNEQSIAKSGNWATSGAWDSLQVSIGTVPDTALVLLDPYDASTDAIVAPPASGTIARYQGMTLMSQALTDDDPYDMLVSSLTHQSPEYFTAYNQRPGNAERGRPLRFMLAGDSCFALHPGGFVHVYKSSDERPVQFVDTINGPGLDGKWAAQRMGNSILMISAGQLRMMGGNDGNVVDLPGFQRLLTGDWKTHIADYVSGGYDSQLNCSMFLNASRAEVLCLWHGSSGTSMFEGANFRWMTSGPEIADGRRTRAYFVTARGRIVSPDYAAAGSGTMFDLSSGYTLAGSATGGSTGTLVCSGATFHADMIGAYCYAIDGDNAGERQIISAVDVGNATLTFAGAFSYAVANTDRFAISPVPVHVRLPVVRRMDAPEPLVAFDRQTFQGLSIKFREISGLDPGVTDTMRVGAYRDAGTAIESETAELTVSATIEQATAAFENPIDGLDVGPYLEYIGVGSSFEITDVQVLKGDSDSKQVT
jgi:hypothetical protein